MTEREECRPSGWRILGANLASGRVPADALRAVLADHQVDAACLQELSAEQAEAVASVLPHGLLAPARDGGGLGIGLRHPGRAWDPDLPGRPALVASLPGGSRSGELEILNVHLRGGHTLRWRRAAATRRLQVRSLLRHLDAAPDTPRLLLGDLNATPLGRAYRALTRRLEDAAARAATDAGRGPPPTWGPFGAFRWLRIDHALSRGVVVRNVSRIDLPEGDHAALLVEIAPGGPRFRGSGRR